MPRQEHRPRMPWSPTTVILVIVCLLGCTLARAQSIEPRQFVNTPVGVNFLLGGYAYTSGGLSFDPSLPVTHPNLETNSFVLGFARSMDFWGHSGKLDVIAPYTWLNGSADYDGQHVRRIVNGFADPAFRMSVNLYGAPALDLKQYASYTQDVIIGAALQVTVPWGQYDDTRLVNIGARRWSFKPSIGISKALDRWTLEGIAAVNLYTDNNDFYGGHQRAQDPLYSLEWHVVRSFSAGIWASLDGTFYTGGTTTIDGVDKRDLQRNWRIGGTLALPVDRRNSVKLYASNGVSARTGNDYSLLGVAWQYRWGGGF